MRQRRQRQVILLALLLAIAWLLPGYRQAIAQNPAIITIEPALSTLNIGQTVSIVVQARGVSNLYGYNVQMRFNPGLTQVLDADSGKSGVQVRAGNLFNPTHTFTIMNTVDNTTGLLTYAASLVEPASPVSGDGVLASFDLQAIGAGISTLGFFQINLISPEGDYLPVDVFNAQVHTRAESTSAQPTSTTSATSTSTLTASPTVTLTPLLAASGTPVPTGIAPVQSTSTSTVASPLGTGQPGVDQPLTPTPGEIQPDSQSTPYPARTQAAPSAPTVLATSGDAASEAVLPEANRPGVTLETPKPGKDRTLAWAAVIVSLGGLLILVGYLTYRYWRRKS